VRCVFVDLVTIEASLIPPTGEYALHQRPVPRRSANYRGPGALTLAANAPLRIEPTTYGLVATSRLEVEFLTESPEQTVPSYAARQNLTHLFRLESPSLRDVISVAAEHAQSSGSA
jgi:hypothetical protein